MKRHCLILLLALGAATAPAQQPTPRSKATPPPIKLIPSLRGKLIYKPSGAGVPSGRVDAGSRGDGQEVASLYVLAPEQVGLTAHSQPTLYWFQTAPAHLPFEFSILQPNNPTPILHIRHVEAAGSGFQHLDLAEHDVSLAPDVDYQWVVALVRDPQSRSRDIVSSGWIRFVERKNAGHSDLASLAADGFWYDTITALSAQITEHPRDAQLQADRRDLFLQVGLPPLPTVTRPSRR